MNRVVPNSRACAFVISPSIRDRAASRRSRERAKPGAKPWFLIATVAVSSVEDALQAWYAFRWRIARAGREIEETGHHVAARPERAIDAVIAWRIITLLAPGDAGQPRRTPVLGSGTARHQGLCNETAATAENELAERFSWPATASTTRRPVIAGGPASLVRHTWRISRNRGDRTPCSVQNGICDDRASSTGSE